MVAAGDRIVVGQGGDSLVCDRDAIVREPSFTDYKVLTLLIPNLILFTGLFVETLSQSDFALLWLFATIAYNAIHNGTTNLHNLCVSPGSVLSEVTTQNVDAPVLPEESAVTETIVLPTVEA